MVRRSAGAMSGELTSGPAAKSGEPCRPDNGIFELQEPMLTNDGVRRSCGGSLREEELQSEAEVRRGPRWRLCIVEKLKQTVSLGSHLEDFDEAAARTNVGAVCR